VKSALARADAGLAIGRRHPDACDAWPEDFCMFHVALARRAAGDVDAAVALFTACLNGWAFTPQNCWRTGSWPGVTDGRGAVGERPRVSAREPPETTAILE
jgi:hypothetical protein